MTIEDKIIDIMKDYSGVFSKKEIIENILKKYPNTNRTSITIADYCYNRVNKDSKTPLLEFIKNGYYRFLGKNYKYTGEIFIQPQGTKEPIKIGYWENGKKILFKKNEKS